MNNKPVSISATQQVLVAIRSVERAQLQLQRVHGQVTPQLLQRVAILQGLVQQLARLVSS